MRQIAASMGLGGISSAIMRSLSNRYCFAAASSWCCLYLGNASAADAVASLAQMAMLLSLANAVAGNPESADTVARFAATIKTADMGACSANKEQHCSWAGAISANVAPCSIASQQQHHWQESFSPTLQCTPATLGKVVRQPTPTLPMLQRVRLTHGNNAL